MGGGCIVVDDELRIVGEPQWAVFLNVLHNLHGIVRLVIDHTIDDELGARQLDLDRLGDVVDDHHEYALYHEEHVLADEEHRALRGGG